MKVIRYDGSFYGLICALAPFLKTRDLPDAIERENASQPSLIAFADESTGTQVTRGLTMSRDPEIFRIPGIAKESWRHAWHAFLSEAQGIEISIARYLLLALEKHGSVDLSLTDDRVRNIHRRARQVLRERHRFMGLLRFRSIGDNLYYASIHSDNFILPVLAPFFVERFADQQWIIHDRRREVAAVYNLQTWTIIERDAADLPADSVCEENSQHLWQCFFAEIAVRERLNLALQQKFIPRKYWHDLIEKPGC